jgi:hypothetical protein
MCPGTLLNRDDVEQGVWRQIFAFFGRSRMSIDDLIILDAGMQVTQATSPFVSLVEEDGGASSCSHAADPRGCRD